MIAPVLAARDVTDLVKDAEFLWLVGALVATLLVAAVLIAWVDRWRKRQLADSPRSEMEQINTYRAMFERGELSKEEYDRIRLREAQRVRDRLAAKETKTTAAAPSKQEPPVQPSPQESETPPPPA